MVFSLFNNDPIFNTLFFGMSSESKPPCEYMPIYDEESSTLTGCQILYALAGCRKEDVKVWSKQNVLYLEVNSDKKDSPVFGSKFVCKFKREITVTDKLDLANLKATFENGLLKIVLPVKAEVESDKLVHFGV